MPAKSAQDDRPDLEPLRLDPSATGAREPGDDFFCLRFRVWYNSYDCAIRTHFETCSACLRCDQGRFNLRRHRAAIGRRSLVRACRG